MSTMFRYVVTYCRNWDSDVRKDMIDALDKLAPEKAKYRHNAEGPDDMVLLSLLKTNLARSYKISLDRNKCFDPYLRRKVGARYVAGNIPL